MSNDQWRFLWWKRVLILCLVRLRAISFNILAYSRPGIPNIAWLVMFLLFLLSFIFIGVSSILILCSGKLILAIFGTSTPTDDAFELLELSFHFSDLLSIIMWIPLWILNLVLTRWTLRCLQSDQNELFYCRCVEWRRNSRKERVQLWQLINELLHTGFDYNNTKAYYQREKHYIRSEERRVGKECRL